GMPAIQTSPPSRVASWGSDHRKHVEYGDQYCHIEQHGGVDPFPGAEKRWRLIIERWWRHSVFFRHSTGLRKSGKRQALRPVARETKHTQYRSMRPCRSARTTFRRREAALRCRAIRKEIHSAGPIARRNTDRAPESSLRNPSR